MKRFRDYILSEQRDVQKMNLSDIKKYVVVVVDTQDDG